MGKPFQFVYYVVQLNDGNFLCGHKSATPKLYKYPGIARLWAKKLGGTVYSVNLATLPVCPLV